MANPRTREFFTRYQERLQDVRASAALEGREVTRAELDAARDDTVREAQQEVERHDRLLEDIDHRIRNMPPIRVVPMSEVPSPDPNELNLAMRMAAVRETRRRRRLEQREAIQRGNARTEAVKVDTSDSFAPKRKLDIE